MSTVCRNCRVRVQRLQDDWNNTPSSSGSRRRAPGTLRSQRGVTQSIHDRRTDLSVLERRRQWHCKSDPEAKIAAFLKVSSERKELRPASSRTPSFSTTVATGLKPGREHPSSFSPRVT